jgi:Sulfotransferase family
MAEPNTMEASREVGERTGSRRENAPVFVLGCVRSGTKLLYHMLLSSGSFCVYRTESNVFNLLEFKFGNLRYRKNRQKLLDAWLRSKLFQRSELEAEEIAPQILENCRNGGDFLRILMETIARKQGVKRWAETTPQHLLYLPLIKKLIPDALIVHIIRDGRDVAVSLNKIGWIHPFAWDRKGGLLASGLFWKWMVLKGRNHGRKMGPDYMEVHYEELVNRPRETLAEIGRFIGEDLDYDRILSEGMDSVKSPNSSFKSDENLKGLRPVGRWKTLLTASEVTELEAGIGDLLTDLDYPLASVPRKWSLSARLKGAAYLAFFNLKQWLKSHTPLGRSADVTQMEIDRQGSF